MAVASFSLAPDTAVDLAWKLGLSLRWLAQDTNGGSAGMSMLGNALRAVETGAADVVLVLGGDATGLAGYAKVAANYNTATQKHLSPLGHGGPNGVYALVASRGRSRNTAWRNPTTATSPSRSASGPRKIPTRSIARR